MSKYQFSAQQRFAVFSVHGERCYLCSRPVDLKTMEVDHVLPEALQGSDLARAILLLGRPASFDLNSFENWLPSCRPCNRAKAETVFDAAPIVLVFLQRAARGAAEAERRASAMVTGSVLARALNTLERAADDGPLDDATVEQLAELVAKHRPAERVQEPVHISPLYTVISEPNGLTVVRGPYGVGARPSGSNVDPSFSCATCGSIGAWNGPRCVICGHRDDD